MTSLLAAAAAAAADVPVCLRLLNAAAPPTSRMLMKIVSSEPVGLLQLKGATPDKAIVFTLNPSTRLNHDVGLLDIRRFVVAPGSVD